MLGNKYRNKTCRGPTVLRDKKKAWPDGGWDGYIGEGFPKEVTTDLGFETEIGSDKKRVWGPR